MSSPASSAAAGGPASARAAGAPSGGMSAPGGLRLFALVFGGLQVWWIGSTLRRRELARPLNERAFRKSLERIWAKQP